MNTELIPQLWSSSCFLTAGMIGALVSDLLSVCTLSNRRSVRFFCDFFLLAVCSLLLFLTSVSVVQDTLRGYMLAMFLFGAVFWERTAGRILRRLLRAVLRISAGAIHAAARLLHQPLAWLKAHHLSHSKENLRKKNKKAGKSTSIFFANRLK